MPGPGKDIIGKIVDFLRENGGEASIMAPETAERLDCRIGTLTYSLKRLKSLGIIDILSIKQGELDRRTKIMNLALTTGLGEGDDWREKLKRKPAGSKTEAGANDGAPVIKSHPAKKPDGEGCNSEGCLRARKILLEDLVKTYERLKGLQGENETLRSTETKLKSKIEELERKVEELERDLESKRKVCDELRDDVNTLDSQLRKLRAETSQSPKAVEKNLNFDRSGAVILPNEGPPDTR